MSNIFDFGFFKIEFDDENREAHAYKNLDLAHDYVYEDDEDALDEDEYDGWCDEGYEYDE